MEFVFDQSDKSLRKEVFAPIKHDHSIAIDRINQSLQKVGAYVRLYYHLLATYQSQSEEDPKVHQTVLSIESLRRDVQAKVAESSPSDNEAIGGLLDVSNTILFRGGPIIEAYDSARDHYLALDIQPKHERLDRIYRVLDAEKSLFKNYPETQAYYSKTGQTHLDSVFNGAPKRHGRLRVRHYPL